MYFCICELGVGSGSWCKIRWVVVKKFESHCPVWRACGPRSEGSSWIWGPRGLRGCCGEDEKLQTIGCGQRGAGVFPAPSGDSMQASVQLFDSGCGFQMGRNSDPKKSERWLGTVMLKLSQGYPFIICDIHWENVHLRKWSHPLQERGTFDNLCYIIYLIWGGRVGLEPNFKCLFHNLFHNQSYDWRPIS